MRRFACVIAVLVVGCAGSGDSENNSFRVGLSPQEGESLCREHCAWQLLDDPEVCRRRCRDYVGEACGRETAARLQCKLELNVPALDSEVVFQMLEDCDDAGDWKGCRDELLALCGEGGVGGTQCSPETLTGLACVAEGGDCDRQQWACFISGGDCDADYAEAICNDNLRRDHLSCSVQECIRIQNEIIETGARVIGDSCTPPP